MSEQDIWVCYPKIEGIPPALPTSKIANCSDCGIEIWYDEEMVEQYPQIKTALRICVFCGTKRMNEHDFDLDPKQKEILRKRKLN